MVLATCMDGGHVKCWAMYGLWSSYYAVIQAELNIGSWTSLCMESMDAVQLPGYRHKDISEVCLEYELSGCC